jgi:hypothetical protein
VHDRRAGATIAIIFNLFILDIIATPCAVSAGINMAGNKRTSHHPD